MSKAPRNTVFVIGTGTMGVGIAQVAAAAGERVLLFDQQHGTAAMAKSRIAQSLERAQAKGYVTAEQRAATLDNLHPVESLEAAGEAAIVVEAVKEDLHIKRAAFVSLEGIVPATTQLWTNTSMILITSIAQPLRYRDRFCGTHFFNPAPGMKLVEVTAGAGTSETTVQRAIDTVTRWGKTPVRAPDSPGFIVNRILDVIKREALDLLDQGVPADQIDTAVRLGLNFPMGPFELMDLIGLNATLDSMIALAKDTGRPSKFSPKIEELVAQGHWGRKTGRGFYTYPANP